MGRILRDIHLWIFAAVFCGCAAFTPARMFSADSWTMRRTAISLATGRGLEIGPGGEVERAPNGKYYSVYGFVEPLITVPLIWLGFGIQWAIGDARHAALFDGQDGGFTLIFLFNAAVCALIAVQVFRILNRLSGNRRLNFFVALCAVFSTMALPYSRDYYVQPLMAWLLLCIVEACAEFRLRLSWRVAAWLGIALSLLLLNRLDGVVAWLPVGAWMLYCFTVAHGRAPFRPWLAALAAFSIACMAGLSIEVWHNYLRAGDPLYLDRRHIHLFMYNPFVTGIQFLFNPSMSLLFYMPLLLLLLVRPDSWQPSVETSFCFLLAALYFLFYASYEEFYGGVTLGPRLMAPLMPLLIIPIGARAMREWDNRQYRIGFYALAGLGVAVNVLESIMDYSRGLSVGMMTTNVLLGEGLGMDRHPEWTSGAWAVRRLIAGPFAAGALWLAATLGASMILIVMTGRRLRNESNP